RRFDAANTPHGIALRTLPRSGVSVPLSVPVTKADEVRFQFKLSRESNLFQRQAVAMTETLPALFLYAPATRDACATLLS
ncbi:MAG TPA: hypothetical protein VFV83_01145, partial [Chthoniobacteraceae bacterium]|nr:hypothetical protein [Chthoniobacteraceae bacterium]